MSNTFKTALLLGAMSALLLFIGETLGGAQGLVIAFGFALLTNFVSYWFSDKIVLKMYRATEVGPEHRLFQTVQRLAVRAGLPQPRCYIIPDQSPNAFATGRNPEHAAVAVTEGILQILNNDELEGVLAHELAHVKHRDILISSVAATVAAAIMMASRFAMFFGGGRDDRREGSPIALIATIILAPIAAMLIQAAISRSREFDADAGRRIDRRVAARPRDRAAEDRGGVARGADGRESGDGAHVHHQAVFGRRADGAVQHPPPHQAANRSPASSNTPVVGFSDGPAGFPYVADRPRRPDVRLPLPDNPLRQSRLKLLAR